MKNAKFTIFTILIILFSCNNDKKEFKIQGEISNLTNDTIFIYDQEKDSITLDTIYIKNGKFSYTVELDTTTIYNIIFSKPFVKLPIFAEKGLKVSIKGDSISFKGLKVQGGNLNNSFTDFRHSIIDIQDIDTLQNKAANFIKGNPYSPVSIEILNTFFILQKEHNYMRIDSLINSMSGELQDKIIVKRLTEQITKLKDTRVGERAPSFSVKNMKDETISFSSATYRSKYILLNFWASWSDKSLEANETIKRLKNKFKSEDIEFIGISLDFDKDKWSEQIKNDTLNWEQVTELNGWENSMVKQYGIQEIPYTILISPQRIIRGRNLSEEELTSQLEEAFKKDTKQKTKTK